MPTPSSCVPELCERCTLGDKGCRLFDRTAMKIAITVGIGVGKSYVCRVLNSKGFVVYDCDDAAKRLMATDENLRQERLKVVGKDVYSGEILQKSVLAKFLLASDENKKLVEDVVHPYVARDFEQSGMDWLESAILFEAGFDKRVKIGRATSELQSRQYLVCRLLLEK